MALCNYRKIDVGKLEGRRKLIDTFVNSVFLYDDHLKIIYNGKEKEEVISLKELESSKLSQIGQPKDTVSTVFFRFTRSFRKKSNVSLRLSHPFGVAF